MGPVAGRVHGASTGVHACGSINAWRNKAPDLDEAERLLATMVPGS